MNHYKMIVYILFLIVIIQFIIIISISLCKKNNYTRTLTYDIILHENYRTILYKGKKKETWRKVYDDKGTDITSLILRYAGPNKNFYNIKTKIKDIYRATSFIEFEYEDGMRKFDKFIEF